MLQAVHFQLGVKPHVAVTVPALPPNGVQVPDSVPDVQVFNPVQTLLILAVAMPIGPIILV